MLKWQHYEYSKSSAGGWYDDNIDISTRFNDIEMVNVLLVKLTETGELVPWVKDDKHPVQFSTLKLRKINLPISCSQYQNHFPRPWKNYKTRSNLSNTCKSGYLRLTLISLTIPTSAFTLSRRNDESR
ncbi:hypothetical protein [Xenorhabdus nematophila]|uniref:hypothetical protein n=1 Tax=Xenorhabdus nematophila TaxID=628 RepID=UPI001F17F4EB|nr:hypothetical protein [Xenorhabdus nematophila]